MREKALGDVSASHGIQALMIFAAFYAIAWWMVNRWGGP